MTSLRELMHETVDHEHANLVRLASRARTRGTSLRRRRRVAAAGASLGVLAVAATGLVMAGVLPGAPRPAEVAAPADPTPPVPSSTWAPDSPGCTDLRADLRYTSVPEAGKALKDAVLSLADGSATVIDSARASATCHAAAAVRASIAFAPADGSSAGRVSVSYDPEVSTVSGVRGRDYVSTCYDEMRDCQITTLADGSVLRTYRAQLSLADGDWALLVADRLADDYVISVHAQWPRGEEAVLTAEELAELSTVLTPVP